MYKFKYLRLGMCIAQSSNVFAVEGSITGLLGRALVCTGGQFKRQAHFERTGKYCLHRAANLE